MTIPERIVIQYMTYCQDFGFTPLSRATLLQILSKCAASVRTLVQGLDYVGAAGAEAFDDLCDVVETLGDTVCYRQDNAGCYHCGTTLVCAAALGHEEGVKIRRLDFSDPQGGKSACDRKVATIKSHMRIYLNAGNDIETPEQMRDAILSSGGVPGPSTDEGYAVTAAIFSCPEEGCVKTFVRYSSMQRHLDCGKHQRALQRYTLLDRAAVGYAQKLEGQCAAVPKLDAVAEPPSSHDVPPKGWALNSSASREDLRTSKRTT
ncbi:hypothetical protein AWC38_SpisGene22167 [Stylophora pistillata]|uniref:C2H2-type domain-containing protein n=1 Tax=Stylophora pistillata TaxID=50429 RepID=A0A2B4RBQ8_STYPI|nr:hypothetical protein AWC38_SpisGene22167 [Stylophora pistillata]